MNREFAQTVRFPQIPEFDRPAAVTIDGNTQHETACVIE